MTDLDKLARELLASEYERDGCDVIAANLRRGLVTWECDQRALASIRTALTTAPEGFVLVPVEPAEAMLDAATEHRVGGNCYMCSKWACSEDYARTVCGEILAAAKEVGNG